MGVKIDINKQKIATRFDTKWKNKLEMISTEILNDSNQYCKEDTGTLIASSLIHSRLSEGLLIWQTPYARRQYWQIATAYKDVNPHASWKWFEVAKANHKTRWIRQAQKLMEN